MSTFEHSAQLANDMSANLLFSEEFSDVTINVCGENIPVHKMILASRSKYFYGLLAGHFKESNDKLVTLNDIESLAAFKVILTYIYTGKVNFDGLSDQI